MSSATGFTAVVLGGERPGRRNLAAACGQRYKATLPVEGRPMIARVVACLRASPHVNRIVIAFDDEPWLRHICPDIFEGPLAAVDRVYPTGTSITRTVADVIDAEGRRFPYLVTTADHPLLTARMVDGFCASVDGAADFYVGVVEKWRIKAAMQRQKRTYLPMRDTAVCGANLYALTTPDSRAVLRFWSHIESARKKPWRIFSQFGAWNFCRLATRRLTLDEAFDMASGVIGADVVGRRIPHAEAAVDVDSLADLAQAGRIIRARAALETFGQAANSTALTVAE